MDSSDFCGLVVTAYLVRTVRTNTSPYKFLRNFAGHVDMSVILGLFMPPPRYGYISRESTSYISDYRGEMVISSCS